MATGARLSSAQPVRGEPLRPVEVEGQPLAANVERLVQALEFLGAPLSSETVSTLNEAIRSRNAARLQEILDARVLLVVTLNPESRVKVERGPSRAVLQQSGYTPVLVKVINQSTGTQSLRIQSPQAGPVYAGASRGSLARQAQLPLRENENVEERSDRFLDLEMFTGRPMTSRLSGLAVEYALALIYSSEAGQREATLAFDVGQGNQDLGFRGEVPVLFTIRPAVKVRLSIRDADGRPTTARLTFWDASGHVFPPQAKRTAPDLFFQKQIYRRDGQSVLLPPGDFTVEYARGPEYRRLRRTVAIPATETHKLAVRLERWIEPMDYSFYSGDHHIHAAGCAHYTKPSEGVRPQDMFLQVKGEGLNVGCILTWGPGFDYQSRFFAPSVDEISEPFTLLKYDVEVSGFGSQALGHVCLLDLKKEIYPGARGSAGWPTWTTPVLRWAKSQGAFTGYAHSGSGLEINPRNAGRRLLAAWDADHNQRLDAEESARGLLPEPFPSIDANQDGRLSERELVASLDRVADQLPNLAIPELNSVGAQEIFVTTTEGLCDFISAMDTARLLEWNCWYHLLNCGFPLKVSGETDFPCMSGTRVGQGRVYVQLGRVNRLDFSAWCRGLAQGRSYVSDGYAHALAFEVNGHHWGEDVLLPGPGTVRVRAKVAFSSETPLEVAYGSARPVGGTRLLGDTKELHEWSNPSPDPLYTAGRRKVELIVNGRPAHARIVPADDRIHDVEFELKVNRSSWVALRQFPQLHTNPINILVAGQPIRASRSSARWCMECIRQLWRERGPTIAKNEREEAQATFEKAIEVYKKIASEAPEDFPVP
jgi:hypothetical protein